MELKFEYIEPLCRYRIVGTNQLLTEKEAHDLQVQNHIKQGELWEVENEITEQIVKDKGERVCISFVNDCMLKHGFDVTARDGWTFELWNFLHSWYQVNRDYYDFIKPVLHIEQ